MLSSENREIYYDALMVLYDMFKFELNIRTDDYLASLVSVLEDKAFTPESDDETQETGLTTRDKARLILNRFIKTGWVDKEFLDGSFIEIITPRNYSIHVLKLLSKLADDTPDEYNSLVFATFSGLKQAMGENRANVYEAVLSARANTEQLNDSLRTLYHGIRGFMRGIIERNDVNLLLQDHFGEYKKMSDHYYHPIKTMDSVHRYRAPIQNLLADILADGDLMQSMRERAMSIKNYDEAQAGQEVISAIDYVMDAYQAVGGLVSEIDRKHSAYTKSSIEKIQYLMTADQTILGKLAKILKLYSGTDEDGRKRISSVMERYISAGRQEFLDDGSLYHKNIKSRRIDREPLGIKTDENFSDTADQLLKQLNMRYSAAMIGAFVKRLFPEGVSQIESKDIAIKCDTDFIMLILAVIRQNERGMPYRVMIKEGHVALNSCQIPNMAIFRKDG
ncbi:MAG: DUF5716 family protein [Clostridiales bacterium]|nr:DUF5716 family protein [Clostridiales bacterium]